MPKILKNFSIIVTNTLILRLIMNILDQINGVAMGSPLAPILADLFMTISEENINKSSGKKPEI